MNSISPFLQTLALSSSTLGKPQPAADGTSFKDYLLKSIEEVNDMQQSADQAVEGLATGENTSPIEVLSAVQKADLAFMMLLQIRNKIVQAYQDIQNVRV